MYVKKAATPLCHYALSTIMKTHTSLILTPLIIFAALMAACKPSDSSGDAAGKGSGSDPYAVAADAPVGKEVEVTANDQMKFSLEFFDVEAGQVVRVTLKNVGSMPKMSMGHNLVILEQNADEQAFVEAAMNAPTTDYVPADKSGVVIAYTKLLGPDESDSITFKAPTKKGRYTFICSFPGHFQVGMKGFMVVR